MISMWEYMTLNCTSTKHIIFFAFTSPTTRPTSKLSGSLQDLINKALGEKLKWIKWFMTNSLVRRSGK